jgi:hypothetical protein
MSKGKKTIVATVDNKGGVGKSVSSAILADALQAIGYEVAIADGDVDNQTISQIFKGIPKVVDIENHGNLDDFFADASTSECDIVVLDMPGRSSENFRRYVEAVGMDNLRQQGVRLVLALALSETSDAVDGAVNWVSAFSGHAEFFLLATGKDSKEDTFDINAVDGAEHLLGLSSGRIVHIPKFAPVLHDQFKKNKATPSSYASGEAKKELNLSYLHASRWKKYLQGVIDSVEPVAEWLTGKPVPKPMARTTEKDPKIDKFRNLVSKLEEARQARRQGKK